MLQQHWCCQDVKLLHLIHHKEKVIVPHGIPAWYIGPALEHYRCYKVYVPKTRAERICDTVSFHPHLCSPPVLQPLEQAVIAADKLTTALQQIQNKHSYKSNEQTTTLQALEKLSNITICVSTTGTSKQFQKL